VHQSEDQQRHRACFEQASSPFVCHPAKLYHERRATYPARACCGVRRPDLHRCRLARRERRRPWPKNPYSQEDGILVYCLSSGVPRGRFSMQGTDLETQLDRPLISNECSSYARSLYFPAILIATYAIFGAAQCSARMLLKRLARDALRGKASRRNPSTSTPSKILSALRSSRPKIVLRWKQRKSDGSFFAEKPTDVVDARSLAPDAPLGDVARRFRKQKESQKLRRSAEFHLPLAEAPALASPKPPVAPLLPPVLKPALPNSFLTSRR